MASELKYVKVVYTGVETGKAFVLLVVVSETDFLPWMATQLCFAALHLEAYDGPDPVGGILVATVSEHSRRPHKPRSHSEVVPGISRTLERLVKAVICRSGLAA